LLRHFVTVFRLVVFAICRYFCLDQKEMRLICICLLIASVVVV
jgi:hypothetical protein